MNTQTAFVAIMFVYLFISVYCDSSLSDNHKRKLSHHFVTFGVGCLAKYNVSFEDIRALQNFDMPKGKDAPCFFACILKRANMIDSNGKVSPAAVAEVANMLFTDEDEFNAVVSVFLDCSYVNDLEVSDGDKGCDRAKLVLSCIMDETKMESPSVPTNPSIPTILRGEDVIPTSPFSRPKRNLRDIIGGVFKTLLQLACTGVSKEYLHGKIITGLLPGLENVNILCRFIS